MRTKLLFFLICLFSIVGSSCESIEIGPNTLVASSTNPQLGENVHFTAPYDSNTMRYDWDFGNGLTSSTVSAEEDYTYNTAGTYDVTVDVHYADNSTRTFSVQLTVR